MTKWKVANSDDRFDNHDNWPDESKNRIAELEAEIERLKGNLHGELGRIQYLEEEVERLKAENAQLHKKVGIYSLVCVKLEDALSEARKVLKELA